MRDFLNVINRSRVIEKQIQELDDLMYDDEDFLNLAKRELLKLFRV